MLDEGELGALGPLATAAVTVAHDRLWHASSVSDIEATLGAAKDLIETAAKVVIDRLGGAVGSNANLSKVARTALKAIGEDGSAFIGRGESFDRLTSSLVSGIEAIGTLRNSDGTGHGHPTRSPLDRAHAIFIRDAALCWSRWLLATAARVLATRATIDTAVIQIEGSKTFHRAELPDFLENLGYATRSPADQRRLGMAVARRWRDNETYTPLRDVIDPAASGSSWHPPFFVLGLIEGLLFDRNGFIRLTSGDAERVLGMARSLPAAYLQALEALSEVCDDALAAPGFDTAAQQATANVLRASLHWQENLDIAAFAQSIINRLAVFRVGQGSAVEPGSVAPPSD